MAEEALTTRRGIFGHVAGMATLAIAGPAMVSVAVADPVRLALADFHKSGEEYDRRVSGFGAHDDYGSVAAVTIDASWNRIVEQQPRATTKEGAIEALRMIVGSDYAPDAFSETMAAAALAYLETL